VVARGRLVVTSAISEFVLKAHSEKISRNLVQMDKSNFSSNIFSLNTLHLEKMSVK
jgi:hypothetical protein